MRDKGLLFLPEPQQIIPKSGHFSFKDHKIIQINMDTPQKVYGCAKHLQQQILKHSSHHWQITAGQNLPEEKIGLQLWIDPSLISKPQGYLLNISPPKIQITGADPAAVSYGVTTLCQILSQKTEKDLPCMQIIDWPDFLVRGIMLDISRDKIYRMTTLYHLIDLFADLKINQLQLYMEHTFAYQGHEVVWQNASPLIPENVLDLDRYCRERFIDLVPNQNSFGHMTRWLQHAQYQALAETTQPAKTPWGHVMQDPFSLAAVLPDSIKFIKGLYDQLLPHFSSQFFNVGCDETFDLGTGKSKQACQNKGNGRVYLDYLLKLYQDVHQRGLTMQFWGDIILQHPELVPELPEDCMALDWGYEAQHPFAKKTLQFKKAGVRYYVCPGTSSWNSLGGRTDNAFLNIKNAARFGFENGAEGLLNTDWGDNGHWQQLPISYPGFMIGAAFSWQAEPTQSPDIVSLLNQFVLKDEKHLAGKVLFEIGNAYQNWGMTLPNSSPIFWLLQESVENLKGFLPENTAAIHNTLQKLTNNKQELQESRMTCQHADLITREIQLTIQLMQHACQRALWLMDDPASRSRDQLLYEINGLLEEYCALWLLRNRKGGLKDSLHRFNNLREAYEKHT